MSTTLEPAPVTRCTAALEMAKALCILLEIATRLEFLSEGKSDEEAKSSP